MIKLDPVKSSALAAMHYDQATETLTAQYHAKDGERGAIWAYAPVAAMVYGAMLLPGASIGAIFAREVRANPMVIGRKVPQPQDARFCELEGFHFGQWAEAYWRDPVLNETLTVADE